MNRSRWRSRRRLCAAGAGGLRAPPNLPGAPKLRAKGANWDAVFRTHAAAARRRLFDRLVALNAVCALSVDRVFGSTACERSWADTKARLEPRRDRRAPTKPCIMSRCEVCVSCLADAFAGGGDERKVEKRSEKPLGHQLARHLDMAVAIDAQSLAIKAQLDAVSARYATTRSVFC